MPHLREFIVTVLSLSAATVALAVPTHSQAANASLPVSQVIIWGDSMSLNWYAYLQPLLNVPVIPNGEGSTDVQQIEAKFNTWFNNASPTERATTGHICWCGGVNANIYHEGDPNTDLRSVVPAMQRMRDRLPDTRLFEPMSLSNMPEAARGTEGYGIAIDDGNPATFTATNEQMEVVFGSAYAEVRSYMVTNGLADAGLSPTGADTTNIQQDVVPESLRQNATDPHLNDAGKQVVAGRMNALLRADGWVPPDMRTATTTTAVSSGNPSVAGAPVQVTATVRNATTQGGQPTGTVQFIVDARPMMQKVTLNSSGVAVSPPIANLEVGTHSISAVYSGTPTTFKSSKMTISQVVSGQSSPDLTKSVPAANATSIAPAANVSATFNRQVTGVGTTTFKLTNPAGTVVPAAVTYNSTNLTATLNPSANLEADTLYTATLIGGTSAIRDTAGNPLATTSWTFLSGPAPRVSSTVPANGATGVDRTANVTATFNEAVNGVSGTTVTLTNVATGQVVTSAVTRFGTSNKWILDPSATLAANTNYRITLTGDVLAIRDLAGNPLVSLTRTFTTGA